MKLFIAVCVCLHRKSYREQQGWMQFMCTWHIGTSKGISRPNTQAQALAPFIYVVYRVMCVDERLWSLTFANALFNVLERIKNRTNSSHAQTGGPSQQHTHTHIYTKMLQIQRLNICKRKKNVKSKTLAFCLHQRHS